MPDLTKHDALYKLNELDKTKIFLMRYKSCTNTRYSGKTATTTNKDNKQQQTTTTATAATTTTTTTTTTTATTTTTTTATQSILLLSISLLFLQIQLRNDLQPAEAKPKCHKITRYYLHR